MHEEHAAQDALRAKVDEGVFLIYFQNLGINNLANGSKS